MVFGVASARTVVKVAQFARTQGAPLVTCPECGSGETKKMGEVGNTHLSRCLQCGREFEIPYDGDNDEAFVR